VLLACSREAVHAQAQQPSWEVKSKNYNSAWMKAC